MQNQEPSVLFEWPTFLTHIHQCILLTGGLHPIRFSSSSLPSTPKFLLEQFRVPVLVTASRRLADQILSSFQPASV
uniref:Uncharacterized protein n=1 Tax=Caenorhabditis japonica TaxID=281687 RepID=A0A8R1EWZ4_CAEJA